MIGNRFLGLGKAAALAIAFLALSYFSGRLTLAQEAGEHLLLEVPVRGIQDVQRLSSSGLDVAGVDRKAGTAAVVATARDLEKLGRLGFAYTVVETSHPLRSESKALADYTDPQELSAFMDQVQAAHPTIAKKVVLEDTLFEGQKQYAMKITKDVDQDHDRPAFLLDGQHHAREVMTAEITKDAIDYLTSRYGTDPQVTNWVDNIVIWVIPCINPDGSMYVFQHDNMWRKNRHPNCAVDINRNYVWSWNECDGSSGLCGDETFRGASPGSEPETKGASGMMASLRPVFNLSYHSFGEYLLYPLGCTDPNENDAIGNVAQALNSILEDDSGATGHYDTGPSWSTIYVTDGSSDDEAYGQDGIYAFVIEVNGESFQPDYATWRNITVQRQRTAWQFFLDRTLTTPSIQGHITDSVTGQPLQANVSVAEVTFTHGEAPRQAGPHGRYHWLTVPGRTYHVTYSMAGYVSQTLAVTTGEGVTVQDVALVPMDPTYVPHDPSPANGAKDEPSSVDLSWEVSGVTSFDVYLGTSQDPPKVATVTAPAYAATGLEAGKTYYWKVVSNTATGPVSGPLWSLSTSAYEITAVTKYGGPFRLDVTGAPFNQGCTITINGVAAPQTVYKGETRLQAKGGSALKAMVPKGTTVNITVQDASGGKSAPFPFSW